MSSNSPSPRLALGPILYYWSRDSILEFYERVADLPVDVVYLGETVCSKRRTLRTGDWLDLAQRLTDAGKEVVLSTLALLEAEAELKTLRRLCERIGNPTAQAAVVGQTLPSLGGAWQAPPAPCASRLRGTGMR